MEETQACCSQLEGQSEGAEEERNVGTVVGGKDRTEEVKPMCDLYQPPVNWEQVCKLKPSEYIDYKGLIMHERTPALFPEGCKGVGLCVYIGAMYAHIASGKETTPRRVYFEASDPGKPVMRVPKSKYEGTVVGSYGWDRTNFVYKDCHPEKAKKYIFQIFTPANLNTYGIVADLEEPEEVPTFAALPLQGKVKTTFTYFQTNKGELQDYITNEEGTHGLYVDTSVDTSDSWKVKITSTKEKWTKFHIAKFSPPTPPKDPSECY